jgi:hypothetical protein
MRELGLCVTSAGSIRIVKRHVSRLGLDTSRRVIAGRVAILLGNYAEFVVGSAAFLMQGSTPAA